MASSCHFLFAAAADGCKSEKKCGPAFQFSCFVGCNVYSNYFVVKGSVYPFVPYTFYTIPAQLISQVKVSFHRLSFFSKNVFLFYYCVLQKLNSQLWVVMAPQQYKGFIFCWFKNSCSKFYPTFSAAHS